MAPARHVPSFHLILVLLLVIGETVLPQRTSAALAADPPPNPPTVPDQPGDPWRPPAPATTPLLPDLSSFRASVLTGNRKVVTGVFVDGVLALPVVQQVCRMCVSRAQNTVTQFAWAAKYGVKGLIAHDYLSGKLFYGLRPGQRVDLIYGDGRVEYYWITEVERYRQTIPGDTATGYIDLSTGRGYDVEGMFRKVYMGSDHVTFQTCIAKDGNLSWGMLFAIAEPRPFPLRISLQQAMQPAAPWLRKPQALPL